MTHNSVRLAPVLVLGGIIIALSFYGMEQSPHFRIMFIATAALAAMLVIRGAVGMTIQDTQGSPSVRTTDRERRKEP